MYPCTLCEEVHIGRKELLAHIRNAHHLTAFQKIPCAFCETSYSYNSYRNHLSNNHNPAPAIQQLMDQNQDNPEPDDFYGLIHDNIYHGDFNDQQNDAVEFSEDDDNDANEEEIFVLPPDIVQPDPALPSREALMQGTDAFREKCFEKWLQFSSHPDATEKSASLCCDLLLESAVEVINLCKPFLEQGAYSIIMDAFNDKIRPLTTEYRRKQHLNTQGYYVAPKPYVIDYQHVNVRTEDGVHLTQKPETVALPSIRESLLAILSNSELADELVMPSDFTNTVTWDHPFCGTRTQNLLIDHAGEDFLAIQLFMDEFTTTCPIASKSATYKMAGCYIRLLNLPVDLLSKLDHIFLCFIAHAKEIMGLLQIQLSKTVVVELKSLESEGIFFNYRGTKRRFKVILLNLAADNLGIHQLGGLILSFSTHDPCRMCTVTAESLKEITTLDPDEQKTAARYDELIATGDLDEMWTYGIRDPCAFNALENFHIMTNITVDIMHDLLEGHFQKVIPMVLRDAMVNGFPLARINNAIKAFQFSGPDNQNPPAAISLPANAPGTGDNVKMGANEMSTFVKLLPLIFKFAGIRLNTPIWTMFMSLQRIIDILWAHSINEATTVMLDQLIQNYLRDFQALGGNTTIKGHLPLHYTQVIREMGPLRYLSSMRFEAKHRPFKQYAKVNRCHKNLTATLASKYATMFAHSLYLMRKGNYLAALRRSRAQ